MPVGDAHAAKVASGKAKRALRLDKITQQLSSAHKAAAKRWE